MEKAQIVQNTTNLPILNSKKSISSAIMAIFSIENQIKKHLEFL
jgi:hypothetical protein